MLKLLVQSLLIVQLAGWLAACSSGPPEPTITRSPGKPGAPVKLESNIPMPLEPGQPGDIVVTLTPSTSLDQLRVTFRGDAGLALIAGQVSIFATPVSRAPIAHRVTVMAAQQGHYYLSAVLTAEASGSSTSRVVSVPITVGDPAKFAKVQKKALPPVDVTGERIKSLPAVERVR